MIYCIVKRKTRILPFFYYFSPRNKKIVANGIKKCVFDTHILKFFGKAEVISIIMKIIPMIIIIIVTTISIKVIMLLI
jgi:hypothetical protein